MSEADRQAIRVLADQLSNVAASISFVDFMGATV